MQRYIDVLNKSGADAWEINDIKTRGWEFYFIGHRLDQNRAKEVEHITLKVYKDLPDGESMGSATAEVPPEASDAELKKTVSDLVYKASLVKNRKYELNRPGEYGPLKDSLHSLQYEAAAYINAMKSVSETETEDLNSYEIFVNQNERRLITSTGIDITEKYPTSMLDVVVNAREDDHEIELYRLYHMGECDPAQLKEDIDELLQFGRDRLKTMPTPALGSCPVVLSTDAALRVYEYFLDNMNAAYVVRGMSRFEIGKPVADDVQGDKITLTARKELPGSPSNFACDSEGAPVKDTVLIEDGVALKFFGNRMFSQYLGLEDSFNVTNWSVKGGEKPGYQLRFGQFLEIVEFSDFQVDSMTGDIFGEIRLAYFHDGSRTVIPVCGGSISGSMLDNLGSMYMSSETRRYANAEIPQVTRLEHVTVAGVEG